MKRGTYVMLAGLLLLSAGLVIDAVAGEPMFMRWLVAGDPGDETIGVYWERETRGELSPAERVDLATMLFVRGYPKDAVRLLRRALKDDPELYEAWFRIGLVEHRQGRVREARHAYKKCLKLLKGHGWCNFYLGLLHEQEGEVSAALDRYRRAFKVAPDLSDPRVNPEVLYSKLAIGAIVRHHEGQRFAQGLPMAFLEPDRVAAIGRQFEPEPAAAPPAAAAPPVAPEKERAVERAAPAPPPARLRPAAPDEGQPRRPRQAPETRELHERGMRPDRVEPPPGGGAPAPRIPNVSPEGSV